MPVRAEHKRRDIAECSAIKKELVHRLWLVAILVVLHKLHA